MHQKGLIKKEQKTMKPERRKKACFGKNGKDIKSLKISLRISRMLRGWGAIWVERRVWSGSELDNTGKLWSSVSL
jgi:hypothetical protein